MLKNGGEIIPQMESKQEPMPLSTLANKIIKEGFNFPIFLVILDREGEPDVSDYDKDPDHYLHDKAFTSREEAEQLAMDKAVPQANLRHGRQNPTETMVIEINNVEDFIAALLQRSNTRDLA